MCIYNLFLCHSQRNESLSFKKQTHGRKRSTASLEKMRVVVWQSLWMKERLSRGVLRISSARPQSRRLTQEACQLVGFLLLDGLVVQRLKEDIQNQDVISENRWKREAQSPSRVMLFVFFPLVSSATFLDVRKRGQLPALPADNAAHGSIATTRLPPCLPTAACCFTV